MERFEKQTINREDHAKLDQTARIIRRILMPIIILIKIILTFAMFWYRLYLWVWDGTIQERVKEKFKK